MIGLVVLIGYVAVWIYTARRILGVLQEDEFTPGEDLIDRGISGALAMLLGLLWPLALPIALVMVKPKPTQKALEAENVRLQRHIAELERESGLS